MNEDRISHCLYHLNEERINAKACLDILRSKSIKNRVRNFFSLFAKRDFKYILSKTLKSEGKAVYYSAETTRQLSERDRIAVYTVAFGDYDRIQDPIYLTPNADYYLITNQSTIHSSVWKTYSIEKFKPQLNKLDNLSCARFFKTHPHLLFPEYKYSIFIDGNVQPVTDMRPVVQLLGKNFIGIHQQPGRDCVYQEADAICALQKAPRKDVLSQVLKYKHEGFPKHFGLFQTNVLVREHNLPLCKKIMEEWWTEISEHTKRDQLSFTYVLWKNGLSVSDISLLGNNTALNPRFRVIKHK